MRDAIGRISRGMRVLTTDGQELGTVQETRPSHFQVRGSGGSYWLRRETVRESDGSLTVSFTADELSHHRLTDPGLSGAVPATSRQRAYLPGATPDEASDLYDPETAPAGTPVTEATGQGARGAPD